MTNAPSFTELKEKIIATVSFTELVKKDLRLKPHSGRLLGLCPFHQEKTPSFHVFDDHYYCFGCKVHGDIFSWIQHSEGVDFMGALKWLADHGGIPYPTENISKKGQGPSERIFEFAHQFFRQWLEKTPTAQDYLNARGFLPAVQKRLGFGFAPSSSRQLLNHLSSLGFDENEMEQASLISRYHGRTYDFFQNRVIIPIRNPRGKVIAFGGRALDDTQPKYKNSRYDKGTLLYGIFEAKKAIREKLRCLVVEGYLDAMTLWKAGLRETVACQGTTLTMAHLRQITQATNFVYLVFDGDNAGKNATLKTLELSLDFPKTAFKAVCLPSGDDPANFIETQGVEAFEQLLASSQDLLHFAINSRLHGVEASKIPWALEKEILPWLAAQTSPLRRAFFIAKIAELSGVDETTLKSLIPLKNRHKPTLKQGESTADTNLLTPLTYEFFGLLLYGEFPPAAAQEVSQFINELQLPSELAIWANQLMTTRETSSKSLTSYPGELCRKLAETAAKARLAFEGKNVVEGIACLRLIQRKNNIKRMLTKLKERPVTSNPLELGLLQERAARDIVYLKVELDKIDTLLCQSN